MKRTITLEVPFWIGDRVRYVNPRASGRAYSVDQVKFKRNAEGEEVARFHIVSEAGIFTAYACAEEIEDTPPLVVGSLLMWTGSVDNRRLLKVTDMSEMPKRFAARTLWMTEHVEHVVGAVTKWLWQDREHKFTVIEEGAS